MPKDPTTTSVKELREAVKSVFVLGLPAASVARQLAEQAAGPGVSYLRGKERFERAYELLASLPGSSVNGKLLLEQPQGHKSAAGEVVSAWKGALSTRSTLFDEVGATGPTVLVLRVSGVDEDSLWKDDAQGEPAIVKGRPDARLQFFETAPALHTDKRPDERNGVFQELLGDQVSLKRRGNTSRWDSKINLTVALDKDSVSGFPKQLNLTNCIRDPSYERVRLGWALMAEARCPSEPCAYAELTLNGRFRGTYVALPSADEFYFDSLFPDSAERAVFRGQYGDIAGGASLAYRGKRGADYFIDANPSSRTYEPRLGTEDVHFEKLAHFIDFLNHAPDVKAAAFADGLRQVFDVEAFLRTLVVINLLGAWDNYYLNTQNYFLHFALSSNSAYRASFCAYDLDSVLGLSWPPQKGNWHEKDILFRGTELGNVVLTRQILGNPLFKDYYCDFMAWFLEQRFTLDWFQQKRAGFWSTLEKSAYLESASPYGVPDTERPWTNDQVYQQAVLDMPLHAWSSSALSGLQVLGIADFVRKRREKALALLRFEPIGRSRVDFDSVKWTID